MNSISLCPEGCSINQSDKIDEGRPRAGLSEGQTFLDIHSINHGLTKPHSSVGRGEGRWLGGAASLSVPMYIESLK
jgi:hypothetical protein